MSVTAPIAGLPRIGTRMAPKVEELRKPRVRGEQSAHRREYKNMDKTAAYNLGMKIAFEMLGLHKLAGKVEMIAENLGGIFRGAKAGTRQLQLPLQEQLALRLRGVARRPSVARAAAAAPATAAAAPATAAAGAAVPPVERSWRPMAAAAGIGGVGLLGYGTGVLGSSPDQPVYQAQPLPMPYAGYPQPNQFQQF